MPSQMSKKWKPLKVVDLKDLYLTIFEVHHLSVPGSKFPFEKWFGETVPTKVTIKVGLRVLIGIHEPRFMRSLGGEKLQTHATWGGHLVYLRSEPGRFLVLRSILSEPWSDTYVRL